MFLIRELDSRFNRFLPRPSRPLFLPALRNSHISNEHPSSNLMPTGSQSSENREDHIIRTNLDRIILQVVEALREDGIIITEMVTAVGHLVSPERGLSLVTIQIVENIAVEAMHVVLVMDPLLKALRSLKVGFQLHFLEPPQ